MKIALFFPDNTLVSWSWTWGYAEALKRMGHEVLPCPVPQKREITRIEFRRTQEFLPKLKELNRFDAIIVAGPEHLGGWIDKLYGVHDWWGSIKTKKALLFFESFERDDIKLDFSKLKRLGDFYFFPAIQDAKRFDGAWLPPSVDTHVFKPQPTPKVYNAAFIGSMYEKRRWTMGNILETLAEEIEFKVGGVVIEDLGGAMHAQQTALLAENYRQIKVFLSLPAMSRMLVTKVYEAMACGTFVLAPVIEGEAMDNATEHFSGGKHLAYYSSPQEAAQLIEQFVVEEEAREQIAQSGMIEVHQKHKVEDRLKLVLAKFEKQVVLTE